MKNIKNEENNNFSFIPYFNKDNYFFNIEKNKEINEKIIDNDEWEKIKSKGEKNIINLKNVINKIKINNNFFNNQNSKTAKIVKYKKFTDLIIKKHIKFSNKFENFSNIKFKSISIEKSTKNHIHNLKLGKLNIYNNNVKINKKKFKTLGK